MEKTKSINQLGTVLSLVLSALVILFYPALAPAQAQKELPSVELSPASGAPGTALTITGKSFVPGEEVDIILTLEEGMRIGLGTEKVEAITADQAGEFSAASAVPLMAKPGQYKIEVEGSKGSQAVSTVEVLPKK
jgi:hypothetical protein